MARLYGRSLDERIDRSGGIDACWPFIGARLPTGYGTIRVDGRTRYAHRLALEIAIGRPLLRDELACHRCDNPPCCNPSHLYVGTKASNLADAKARGLWRAPIHRHGEAHHKARLSVAAVGAARVAHADGARIVDLARQYGVHRATMRAALIGRTWAHG